MFALNYVSIILLATTALNLINAVVGWQRRATRADTYFALTMSFATLWTLAAALDYAATPLDLKIRFAQLEAIGYHLVIALSLVFVLQYTGYEKLLSHPLTLALVVAFPATNLALIWTNDWHGWVWASFTPVPGSTFLVEFNRGPAYAYGYLNYLTLAVILVLLWNAFQRGSEITKRQAGLLFFASLLPIVFNLIYQFDAFNTPGLDWTSVTFSLTGLAWLLALHWAGLLDLVPIARHTLFQQMVDMVLVLDANQRLLDFTQAAGAVFHINTTHIGQPIQQVLANCPPIPGLAADPTDTSHTIDYPIADRIYTLRVNTLRDSEQMRQGQVLVLRDVTSLKQANQRLEEEINARTAIELELRKLTRAVEQMANSVMITNNRAEIEYVNPWIIQTTGYSEAEILGQNARLFSSGQTPQETYEDLWQTIMQGQEWRGTFINRKKNGDLYWEYTIISPIRNASGETTHYVAVQEDVTERIRLEQKLEQLATTDGLTGAANRREITQRIDRELARAARYGHATCVILFDIDHFKAINDSLGHMAGDLALKEIARTVRASLRQTDSLGRYGGDEFVILLPETNYAQAKIVAHKLLHGIGGLELALAQQPFRVTASMGIGCIDYSGELATAPRHDFQAIVHLADEALYRAKAAGRNCVR